MLRAVFAASTLFLTGLSIAHAADTQVQQAQIEAQAEKTCNDALEHDNFGSYQSMDECVSATAQKLTREAKAKTADSRAGRPN